MAKRNQKKASLLVLVAMVVLAIQVKSVVAAGDYTEAMMKVVRQEVNAINLPGNDSRPGLIRLLFHDCFVNGCDGSVLLKTSRESSSDGTTEKDSSFNIGLRGFEVIDNIKKKLADYKVSCTDALIFAAREAVYLLSNGEIAYNVDGPGRQDGVISRSEDPAKSLPTPSFTFDQLKENFGNEGFNETELVALSGAHAVGVAHSSFVQSAIDDIDTPAKYRLAIIQERKLGDVVKNNVRDFKEPPSDYNHNKVNMSAKGVLDNSFYNAVPQKMVLFRSDRVLWVGAEFNVTTYKDNAGTWYKDFGHAMEKLSRLKAPTDAPSEIRDVCGKTNNN